MAYLGNAPARSFISFERQVFTIVNSQTAYALSHSVTNENDIRLVVNNVVQEPGSGKAYTATGTALTLSAALTNGTDEMYCVFLGRATATSAPGAGSIGTAQLADLNVTSGKIANDAVTLAKMASGTDGNIISYDASGNPVAVATGNDGQVLTSAGAGAPPVFETPASATNTPAFFATADGQNLSDNTYAKVNLGTEVFDVGGCFASSRFTVPSGEAGKYFLYASVRGTVDTDGQLQDNYATFYLNGSQYLENRMNFNNNNIRQATNLLHVVLDLSVGNYVELYAAVNTTSSQASVSNDLKGTNFGGYKIIE